MKDVVENHDDEEEEQILNLERNILFCGKEIPTKYYILGFFFIINVFLFADQNLLAPNLTIIGEEFNWTTTERDRFLGGYISIGFFIVGGITSLSVGLLTDLVNRKWVLVVTVAIGELSCALTYFVSTGTEDNFWKGLWLTRSITGFAIGGALPVQFSMLGDLFTETERGKAIAVTGMANFLGISFGQYLSNFMTPDWRTPFLIVSLPTFVLLALFVLTTEEPIRGQSERKESKEKAHKSRRLTLEKFKSLVKTPGAVLLIAQGIPGALGWGTFGIYLNDFMKTDLDVDTITVANSLLFFGIVASFSGFYSGYLVDKYISSKPEILPLIAGISTIGLALPFGLIVKSGQSDSWFYYVLLLPAGFIAALAAPIIRGLLLHIALPETRGTAFALQTLVEEIGKGFSPFILSLIIENIEDRSNGLLIGLLSWIPSGIIMMLVYFTISKDITNRNISSIASL